MTLELPGGGTLVAIIRSPIEPLGLAVGKPAYPAVKASDAMVGVD